MDEKYADIIHLSRPISTRHLPMPGSDRAAQFAPFAALTGYDGVIAETARLTERETVLDVGAEAELDEKLRYIRDHLSERPQICVTYFRPDSRKSGGAYLTVSGRVKKLDTYANLLVFTDNTPICIDRICHIE